MRRPLPGANPRAFEPPLQPTALLLRQQAVRAQRAAAQARAERAVLQRQHEQRQAEGAAQQQQQQQPPGGGPPAAAAGAGGGANGTLGASHVPQLLHPVNPFLLKREQRMSAAAEAAPQGTEANGADEQRPAPLPQQGT